MCESCFLKETKFSLHQEFSLAVSTFREIIILIFFHLQNTQETWMKVWKLRLHQEGFDIALAVTGNFLFLFWGLSPVSDIFILLVNPYPCWSNTMPPSSQRPLTMLSKSPGVLSTCVSPLELWRMCPVSWNMWDSLSFCSFQGVFFVKECGDHKEHLTFWYSLPRLFSPPHWFSSPHPPPHCSL